MAEARAKLRKEAEEEKTFIKGLGFCSFGIGSNPATVDVKNGKISRINPYVTIGSTRPRHSILGRLRRRY